MVKQLGDTFKKLGVEIDLAGQDKPWEEDGRRYAAVGE